jgi:hypothetical protein
VAEVVVDAVYEEHYFGPYSMHYLAVFGLEDRFFPD